MSLASALGSLVVDPTFGIPLIIAVGLTIGVFLWSRQRTSELPRTAPAEAPEYWRIQIDSRAYYTLERGQYLVAVDGLGRRFAALIYEKFHRRIGNSSELDSPAVDRLLPSHLSLRLLVKHLTEAYYSAFWAEEPDWLARRWDYWHHRQRRRAAHDFAKVTAELETAFAALEAS